MKIIAGIALISVFALSSCDKENEDCGLVEAKIIRFDCDRVILQFNTDTPIGDDNWEDVTTGTTYTNVAWYANTCRIGEFTNGEKKTLYVKVKSPGVPAPSCPQCLAASIQPPSTQVDFGRISTEPCGD